METKLSYTEKSIRKNTCCLFFLINSREGNNGIQGLHFFFRQLEGINTEKGGANGIGKFDTIVQGLDVSQVVIRHVVDHALQEGFRHVDPERFLGHVHHGKCVVPIKILVPDGLGLLDALDHLASVCLVLAPIVEVDHQGLDLGFIIHVCCLFPVMEKRKTYKTQLE